HVGGRIELLVALYRLSGRERFRVSFPGCVTLRGWGRVAPAGGPMNLLPGAGSPHRAAGRTGTNRDHPIEVGGKRLLVLGLEALASAECLKPRVKALITTLQPPDHTTKILRSPLCSPVQTSGVALPQRLTGAREEVERPGSLRGILDHRSESPAGIQIAA